ncbi:MAG: glycosyltransferase family 2 protein [Solirubrobacterales bacterium]
MRPQVRIPEVHERTEPPLGRFWELIRTDRAHRRRLQKLGASKRRALITMVHNEPVFLPIWISYYSRFFAAEDIYVLDNDTTDGSTDREGFVRIPVHHDSVDHTWMVETIQGLQHELLDRYDVILVTDVDEIVTPTPEWGTLGEYIDEFSEWFVNCIGYELLHMVDREQPYDPRRPILDQRGHWFANGAYNKPALATSPMSWLPGFHHRTDGQLNYEPDLRLIHLHRMDFELCRERHRIRRDRVWKETDVDEGWASYNRTVEEGEFESWFYGDSGFEEDGVEIVVERIPESFRGLF